MWNDIWMWIWIWLISCRFGFAAATLPQSNHIKNKEKNISMIQTFMKYFANLYSVTTFYTNLKFYAFLHIPHLSISPLYTNGGKNSKYFDKASIYIPKVMSYSILNDNCSRKILRYLLTPDQTAQYDFWSLQSAEHWKPENWALSYG